MSSCDSSRGGRWVGRGAMRCAVGKRGRVGVWAVAQSKQQRLPNRDMYANVWLPIRWMSTLQALGPLISDNSELRRAYGSWSPPGETSAVLRSFLTLLFKALRACPFRALSFVFPAPDPGSRSTMVRCSDTYPVFSD